MSRVDRPAFDGAIAVLDGTKHRHGYDMADTQG